MKRHWIHLCLLATVAGVALAPSEADARRFGGGSSSGMKRTLPEQPARPAQQQPSPPPQQQPAPNAQTAQAGTAAAAAAPAAARRSWLGPIAGLAAGLGLAALFSHLGLGAELANFVMLLLLGLVAFFVVRWVMGRMRGPRLAAAPAGAAPAGAGMQRVASTPLPPLQPVLPARTAAVPEPVVAARSPALPPGFDHAAFERAAKQIFIRLQEAHDAGDLDDLRRFTTPEMYASAKLDLMERKGVRQQTEVIDLHAEVIDLAQEQGQDVVSVRYRGLVREDESTGTQPFDEVWHLARGGDGRSDWVIAGIQQIA
jgi:predicted lipid-binding transport protein (Tim44 family)